MNNLTLHTMNREADTINMLRKATKALNTSLRLLGGNVKIEVTLMVPWDPDTAFEAEMEHVVHVRLVKVKEGGSTTHGNKTGTNGT